MEWPKKKRAKLISLLNFEHLQQNFLSFQYFNSFLIFFYVLYALFAGSQLEISCCKVIFSAVDFFSGFKQSEFFSAF